ncbi:hypothetical protein FGO68_gene12886 [Halteria grandinella]|uniref:Uncharacterized protein n=1 Tax=Halteria grandinella TaxID=5974 RepID=A0A8J8T048_HALGN|nr:hypothetical protein FGO68_gene12886 [Halteria grandinella]
MDYLNSLTTTLWNPQTKFTILVSLIRILGFLKLLELLYRVWWTIRRNLRSTAALTARYGKGSWAVVTGGSDGIGLAMAKVLARREFNIVIVSRNPAKMADAANEIKAVNPKIEVRTVEFDFTKTQNSHSVAEYQSGIIDKIASLDISLLINNAGYLVPGDFDRIPLEEHKHMIDVGIMPATMITKLLTDKMLARGKRTGTMFVSSVQAQAPIAGTATYGASKVYMDFLAKALAHEHRAQMDVMSYQCGLVATKFIGIDPKRANRGSTLYQKLFCITPEQAAERALADLPHEFLSHGHFKHDVYALFIRTMALTWFLAPSFNKAASQKANNALAKLQKNK